VPSDEDITEPGQLAQWMFNVGATVSCLTPAMGQLLTTCVSADSDENGTCYSNWMVFKRGVLMFK